MGAEKIRSFSSFCAHLVDQGFLSDLEYRIGIRNSYSLLHVCSIYVCIVVRSLESCEDNSGDPAPLLRGICLNKFELMNKEEHTVGTSPEGNVRACQ